MSHISPEELQQLQKTADYLFSPQATKEDWRQFVQQQVDEMFQRVELGTTWNIHPVAPYEYWGKSNTSQTGE